MKPVPDWRLYLVTDRTLAHPRPLEEVVEAAVRGGVTAVQLREKQCGTRQFVAVAKSLRAILPAGVPLIINDRVDVALAAGADGVHLGQSDMDYHDARRLVGPDRFVGLSVETMEQALAAEQLDADYLGVSPIFPTPTKTDTGSAWGIEGLRLLRAHSRRKLIAIGGINERNAGEVIAAGADGIAVVSAICAAPDPEFAARKLRRIVDRRGPS
ncbi:MAG: thiamine phosphate synthase [Bryobacteraceae bacterium]